jgi:NAD(P)-dependent dehydrogenase (short-subunit alcohol dehydrogenase family)
VTQAPPVLLVTGASSGIGRAVALGAARTGAHVVLVAREAEALEVVAEECRALGTGGASVEVADVGDDDEVGRTVRAVLDREGRLDAVVNAAGVVAYGPLPSVPVEVFDGVIRTNLLGTANIARHVLPHFREQGRGHLVLVGSVLGHLAVPGMTAYIVSKWGVRALARQLVLENRDLAHVHVSCVSPGAVDTPVYESAANYLGLQGRPPPPVSSPEHVARAVLRLLERPRDRRQVGVANNLMRAGFSFLPGVYDVLVGPIFGVAGVDRTTPVLPGPGRVLDPLPTGHSLHGVQPGALTAVGRNLARLVGR